MAVSTHERAVAVSAAELVVSVLRLPAWITMLAPKITAAPAANTHGLAICAPNRNNNPNAATGATKNTALMRAKPCRVAISAGWYCDRHASFAIWSPRVWP